MRDQQLMSADAERILSDPVYAEAFAAVERKIVDALKVAPIDSASDVDRVLKLVMRLQSIAGSRKWLDNQMQLGMLGRDEPAELRKSGLFRKGGL